MKYIDSHVHWSDPRLYLSPEFDSLLTKSLDQQIDFFLLGGVSPDEWDVQLKLKKKYPNYFGLCFGLHPYYVSANEFEVCEQALDQLVQLLPEALALGEMGLDFRPHIVKETESLQVEMFENQLELAKAFQKPVVLHVVQAHDKIRQIFKMWDPPDKGGFVHAFNGSFETAQIYIQNGLLISVGGAVTFEKNRKLQDCVKKIPLEYLLLETDAPDQPPAHWPSDLNDSTSLLSVAKAIGSLRQLDPLEVLEISASNFKRLFR